MTIIFVHGVPDTSALWVPLIQSPQFTEDNYLTPDLPGFGSPWPSGFQPTKDGYAAWIIDFIEDATSKNGGPVDLVGHDWGALLVLRAASLRPGLVRSWTAIDAVIQPGYVWHKTAKRWQTPIVGEALMALSSPKLLRKGLIQAGVPKDLAATEASHWNALMKKSILSLYRSAKTAAYEWAADLDKLPEKGLVIFGENDPFISADIARQFATDRDVPIHVEPDTGHWVLAEVPDRVATLISEHVA
ncbi:MAG: alpha/beta hydrolase [Pseudomonadota bacterium]